MSLRVLCVNPYPIASTCPIGYMSEHLFSNEEFEILEYHSVSCDTYKSLSKSCRVSFNKVNVDVISDIMKTNSVAAGLKGKSSFKNVIKTVLKFFTPIRISKEIEQQICDFRPEVIYTQGYDIRILKFCTYVSKKFNIPVVVHTLDYWFSSNIFVRMFQIFSLNSCLNRGKLHLSASPKMGEYLENRFKSKSVFVTNCSKLNNNVPLVFDSDKDVFQIGYVGNLTPGRHKIINLLSDAIENSDLKDKLCISVYAPEAQLKELPLNKNIFVHNAVSQDKVADIYKSFDFLLHVESFDKEDVFFTKYSLSTKIAECLASGKVLLYFGPQNVGVGDFISKENVGIYSENPNEIISKISEVINNSQLYQDLTKKQQCCALEFFETTKVQERFMDVLSFNKKQTVHYLSFFVDLDEIQSRKKEVAAQSKIRYIADSIKRCGKKLKIVSTALTDNSQLYSKREIYLTSPCEQHIYLPNISAKTHLNGLFLRLSIIRYLLFSVKKDDIVVVYHSPMYFLPLKLFKIFKKNYLVLEFNDLYSLHFTDEKKSSKMRKKENKLLQLPDAFILASPFMQELINNKKSIVNYGSYAKATPNKSNATNIIKPTVIYTGVIESLRNGAFVVAESARYLPSDIKVTIAGYGTDDNIVKLNKLCKSINDDFGKIKVEYVGCLNQTELSNLMFNATLAINAHTYAEDEIWKSKYSFPSKIPLNMAHGLPVVTYPYDIITSSPMNDACIYFEKLTPESMAHAVIEGAKKASDSKMDSRRIISKMDEKFIMDLKELLSQ